jgi:ubiquinone/menaquinone biosynthesis C-methylase UbiE
LNEKQVDKIKKYYEFQSKFYDITRGFILFGRKKLLKIVFNHIHQSQNSKYKIQNILDIACGTGYFMNKINKKYPEINITGIDLSREMLSKITQKQNIKLINSDFSRFDFEESKFDFIILSYALTISGNNPDEILEKAKSLLNKNGIIMVVDFYRIFNFYEDFMSRNNILCHKNIEELLNYYFTKKYFSKKWATPYPWLYYFYIGS